MGRALGGFGWDRLFLVLALPIGLAAVVLIPPMQELDGTAHLLRIDQLARGTLVQPLDDRSRAIVLPDRCLQGFISAHFELGMRPGPMSPREGLQRQPCRAPVPTDISNTAVNTPITYLPALIGYSAGRALGGVTVGFFVARLAGLAAYLYLCWLALRLAPRGKAVLFFVALLPSSLQLASVVSSDGFAIALALLSVALVLRLRGCADAAIAATGRRDLALLAATLFGLSLSKLLYAPLVLLVLLLPARSFRSTAGRRGYQGGVLGAVVLAAGSWALLVVSRVRITFPALGIDSFHARDWAAAEPVSFAASLIRGLWDPWVVDHSLSGYVEVLGKFRPAFSHELFTVGDRAPLWLFVVALVTLGLAIVHDAREGPAPAVDDSEDEGGTGRAARRGEGALLVGAVTVAVIVASTGLILLGDRLVATPFDSDTTQWVQGRYFLPLTPLLVLPAVAVWRGRGRVQRWAWAIPIASAFMLGWVIRRAVILFY